MEVVHCRLAELLEGNMPGFSLAPTRYDEDARKAGCARQVVGEHKHACSGFCKQDVSLRMRLCLTTHNILCNAVAAAGCCILSSFVLLQRALTANLLCPNNMRHL